MKPNWFIAFPISPGRWHDKVNENIPNSFRVFHPNDLHVTVAFLKKCDELQIENIADILQRIVIERFIVATDRPLLLPSNDNFSVLAVGFSKGNSLLKKYISKYRTLFSEVAGIEADSRSPFPHCTIARLRYDAMTKRQSLVKSVNSINIPCEEIIIDRLALYTWNDNRKIMQFKIIKEQMLY